MQDRHSELDVVKEFYYFHKIFDHKICMKRLRNIIFVPVIHEVY